MVREVILYLGENKEWLFGGVGVAVILFILPYVIRPFKPPNTNKGNNSGTKTDKPTTQTLIVLGDNIARDKVINNYLFVSPDYQKLVDDIELDKKVLKSIPANEEEIRIKISEKITDSEKTLERFKQDVYRLYETFSKITVDTERLKQAKELFDESKFREADAILKAEDMTSELEAADRLEKEGRSKINEAQEIRGKVALEFLIKAQLWSTFYSERDWQSKSEKCYEKALRASRDAIVLFNYALFLQKLNQFSKAQPLYQEALDQYRNLAQANPGAYLPDVAMTLNNLAVLHSDKNEYQEALGKYEEALKIRRDLAKANPGAYLPDVASTLNNLAILKKDKNEFGEALEKYEEALKIYRDLAKANPGAYLPYVATTLNNLANLHSKKNEFGEALENYEEALKIYRNLAKANPSAYLPDVALTLNNLANLHSNKNEFGEALENYEEALKIYRNLAKANPGAFLPDVAMTLINLSIFYLYNVPDKDKSIQYAVECIMVAFPMRHIPMVEECIHKSIAVLEANGLNEDEIRNLLTTKDEDEKESNSFQGDDI